MKRISGESNIAIIGGGKVCKAILQIMFNENFEDLRPNILGVADIDDHAVGLRYAREKGLYTTHDYEALYRLEDLHLIIELTGDDTLVETIEKTKPSRIELMDHFEAMAFWDFLRIEEKKKDILYQLQMNRANSDTIETLFLEFADYISGIAEERNKYSLQIKRDLVESERTMFQIVQGSTIPTFVINKDHKIIHWNKACEKLTGYSSLELVGTNKQWLPFRSEERPIMADLVLDQVKEEDVWKYYGTRWRKSALIEGAYEAEEFFPQVGESGKWLFFTAAPIKAADGTILGAIETLWDKTTDRKGEEEREHHHKELAASERALSQIVQGSTIPTFVIDKAHKVIHWNKALEGLTDTPAEEMIGTNHQAVPFWEKERPTMADVILDQMDEAGIQELYGGKSRRSPLIEGAYEAEAFFTNLGENGKWCWFTAAPIRDTDGTIVGAIETVWDKTEDKKAEVERERYTRELTTLCSIYGALNTPTDIKERINEAVQEVSHFLSADGICIYLFDKEGLLNLCYCLGISEASDRVKVAGEGSTLYHVAQSNEFKIFEDLPDGCVDEICFLKEQDLLSMAYIPIPSKERGTLGVIRIASKRPGHFSRQQKNILELIGNRIGVAIENAMLQEQYIKSEKKYRTLFNSNPHPLFILDRQNFEILDTNHRAQDSYGYSLDGLLGIPFLQLGDENDDELSAGLSNLSEGKTRRFTKKRHYRKGGRPFYVDVNMSPTKYGETDVVIASTTDITESVEREAQLIQAGKMTTLGVMAAGMAHEINQPLNVIQICADFFLKMLKRGQPIRDEDLRSMAGDIVTNVKRATGVIKHVRDFARQSEVIKSKVSINEPVQDVFKVLGHQVKVHEIDLHLDLAPDLPFVLGEHNRLEQIFINLVSNAIDAMDEKCGKPVTGECEKRLDITTSFKADHVVVTVTDTGIGMSEEVKNKIFEPFFTTKKIGKGTGLGISISYGIVRDYDGTIELESEVGKGTTFILRFPALPK